MAVVRSRGTPRRRVPRTPRYTTYLQSLEERILFAFGVTAGTMSSPNLSTLVVDNGGELTFTVVTGGSGLSSTVHVGDVSSIKYKGQEMLATYAQTSRFSHYEQGLSSVTAVSYKVDSVNGWILVTCDDSSQSSGVIQYYAVRRNDNNLYMASLPTDVNGGPGEGRFLAYLSKSVFTNIEQPSNIANNTGAIEGSDVFGYADGTTTSKYYNMGRRMIENVYHGVTGAAGAGTVPVGAWMFMGNREHSAGGPFFKDIDFQTTGGAVEIYNCLFTGHTQTEPFRQGLQGPYALQFTNGAQPALPDYSWLETLKAADGTLLIKGLIPAAARGALAGKVTGVAAGREITVGLSNTAAQYWGTPDAGGNFTIPGIRPGTYTMSLYQDELEVGTKTVTITAGATALADIVSTYYTPSAASTVFRIGTWDGTPLGFLNSDKIEIMHPSDVRMSSWTSTPNFVVGANTDAQWPMVQFMGVNNSQRITFNLTAAQVATPLTLRIGITLGFEGGRNRITVNGGQTYAWTSGIPAASRDLNSRGITRGTWRGQNQLYTFNIPASALRAGTNTVDLPVVSGSYVSGQTWLSPNLVYDAIDLVTTSSLTNAPRVTTLSITPVSPSTAGYGTLTFTATARDQFNNVTPANISWSASRGVITGLGGYTAPRTAGPDTVTVLSGTLSASTTVNITANAPNAAPTVATQATASPASRFGAGSVTLAVLGADDDGEANLTYTWSALNPPAPVTFSPNGTNAAKSATATFTSEGTYTLLVTITDSLGASVASQVNVTVLRDQILRYQANAASGTTLADSSGNNLTATLTGSYSFAAGVSGNAIRLTGGNASLPTGFLSSVNDFTIATWMKIDTLNTWSRVFDFGTGPNSSMFLTPRATGTGGPLRFAITTSGGAGEQQLNGPVLTAGTWYHVAVVLSGTTATLYVNGAAVATNAAMTLKPSSLGLTNLNYLGKSQYATDPAFLGSLDDFRVFGRALSPGEVAGLSTPTVAVPAAPAAATVAAPSVGLTVLGADETGGEAGLTYTWATVGTPPAPVTFSLNGTNTAKNTAATFTKPGIYNFQVTITNAAGRSVVSTTSVTVAVSVTGRHFFYGGSSFDTTHDSAIAIDKMALLPEGEATFANYSSFDRGINGLMIDIAGPVGAVSAADFVFRTGNTADPATWAAAPAPLSVTVRPGAGVNGASRIEIAWADGAIRNTWLQVTVKPTGTTNLSQEDLFYFGNAAGESGNSATDAAVTAADVLGVRGRISAAPATITSAWDFNRDGVISAADLAVAQTHLSAGETVLILLEAPPVAASASVSVPQETVAFDPPIVSPIAQPVATAETPPATTVTIGTAMEVDEVSAPVPEQVVMVTQGDTGITADSNTGPAATTLIGAVTTEAAPPPEHEAAAPVVTQPLPVVHGKKSLVRELLNSDWLGSIGRLLGGKK